MLEGKDLPKGYPFERLVFVTIQHQILCHPGKLNSYEKIDFFFWGGVCCLGRPSRPI